MIGATISWVWQKANEKSCDRLMIPMASGIIAGCSLLAVLAMVLQAAGVLPLE
jgi:uncharacterized oligopeptide transporter (OPT) family protein